MTMIRRPSLPTVFAAASFAAALAFLPASVAAQGGLLDSSVFNSGGGLLPAPAPQGQIQAGTGPVDADGGVLADPTATGPAGGRAVDQGTGPLFTARVSLGYTYEDEEDEPTESYFSNQFDLGVITETRNQTFRFNVGADARLQEIDSGFTDPFARLGYSLANRSTAFELDLNWRESDVGDQFLPADFDSDDLILDGGTQEVHSARLTLETGRDRRFGTTTSLGYRQLDYTDTIDPALVNEITYDASTELRFSLDRRVELTVFADWSERSDDDAVQTVETDIRYGVGLDLLIDRAWTGTVDLAITDEEISTTGGVTVEDGYEIDLGLIRDLPNGTLQFSLARDDSGGDGFNSFSATRQMELANGAAFSGSLGLVAFDDGDVLPTLGLNYRNEILRGSVLTVGLDQAGGQSDDNDNILRTTLNATLAQELTRTSRLSVTGALAGVETQGGADPDTLAVSFGLAYSHDLTEDWGLFARANTRINYEDGTRTDRENTFSIGLERTFSYRP